MGEEEQQQTNTDTTTTYATESTGTVKTQSTSEITEKQINDKTALLNETLDINSDLWAQLRSNGFYRPDDMKYNEMFYRFRRIDPYYMVEGGTEYLFFTKPSLKIIGIDGGLSQYNPTDTQTNGRPEDDKIYGGAESSSYFNMLMDLGYWHTLADLCYGVSPIGGHTNDACPFVRILSNRKTSNMDIPDINIEEISTAQNLYGSKLYYPTSSMKSDEDMEFSVEFEDTQFLEIYHFFKAYDKYLQMKYLGLIRPDTSTIVNKILHDHMSVYKFIVDTDGETLLYFAKATGIYPKTISRSSFSEFPEKGQLKITVTFKLSGWFEDMEPSILADFNALVSQWICKGDSNIQDNHKYLDMWDENISGINGSNVNYFYIDSISPTEIKNSTSVLNKEYGRYYLIAGEL